MNYSNIDPEELEELFEDDDDFALDYESDADALASAGFGTDEDYNHFDSWDDEAGYRYQNFSQKQQCRQRTESVEA